MIHYTGQNIIHSDEILMHKRKSDGGEMTQHEHYTQNREHKGESSNTAMIKRRNATEKTLYTEPRIQCDGQGRAMMKKKIPTGYSNHQEFQTEQMQQRERL